jgi:putative chitinase
VVRKLIPNSDYRIAPAIERVFFCLEKSMPITSQQLLQILPNAGKQAGVFASELNLAMGRYQINTPKRIAAFLAQVGHESGQLRYVRELGGDQYLSKYDTGALAIRLGNTPEADGDGQRYRGRGLIQITGRNNSRQCSLGLFGDERLLDQPELLEQPQWAAESAAWFWEQNGLNELADRDQFNSITRRINGGLNGLEDRLQLWARARAVLCLPSV